jgi:putative transposase
MRSCGLSVSFVGRGGESAVQCAALRAQRRPPRHAGRPLRAQSANQGRRGAAEGFEASPADLETAIIERYRRRESSVEEALIEMYLARVSVRRVEDTLWGTRVSPATVSDLNKKI